MDILILSKSPYIYTTDSISQELSQRNLKVQVVNPLECNTGRINNSFFVMHQGQILDNINYVIPRIGSASSFYGLYTLQAFERQGVKTLNKYESIIKCRDKYNIYNTLADKNLPTPQSVLVKSTSAIEEIVEQLNGYPIIAKLTRGSQGKGIMLAESAHALKGIIDTVNLLEEDLMLQEYFETTPKYSDIRIYILNNKVIAASQRINLCDFRSNTHCGGHMTRIQVNNELKSLALRAANCFNLTFCSIDFLMTQKGPQILEINATPGFEKAEKEAQIPLSRLLVDYIEQQLCPANMTT
jgi:ribosomal protein S6--L-glutamate ligase